MIETLKFVGAAVCKKGNVPARLHFRIRNGAIQANNGRLAIQAPIPIDLDCCPHAGQLIAAVAACEEVISMHLDGGRLVVRSGRFKTFVNCFDRDKFPEYTPTGSRFPVPEKILPTLKSLLPFVTNDENRPWANGVLFANNSALATNSICIVEHWLPVAFPAMVNMPREAVAELVRLKLEPTSLQVAPHAVTFHLPGDAWFACSVMDWKWPDTQAVFNQAAQYKGSFMNPENLESLLNDVAKLEKFTDELGAVHFHNGTVSTTPQGTPGTSIECPFAPLAGAFRADQLSALRGIVDKIGFDAYPLPVPFYGGNLLRGVMVGFRD